jgi:tRNA-2-methylthio-N6-dimethylallyladenosine synthase
MPDQIPESIRSQRLAKLDTYLNEVQREFNLGCVDTVLTCLLEGPDKTGTKLIYRTPYMQQCVVNAPENTAAPELAQIKITAANKASLRGELVED